MHRKNLIKLYEHEIKHLKEFNKRLYSENDNATIDPFAEGIIDSIGLLNAKTHFFLEAEFSQTCQSLLEAIAPQALKPIPAMSIVQFESSIPTKIPTHTRLTAKTPSGEPCHFRTGYAFTALPLEISKISLSSTPGLNQKLPPFKSTLCITLQKKAIFPWEKNSLQFFISAPQIYAYMLYTLLFKHTKHIVFFNKEDNYSMLLDKKDLQAEGFLNEQSLLSQDLREAQEHLLMTEFFHYPKKFLFFSIKNIPAFFRAPSKTSFDIYFLLDQSNEILEKSITEDFLALNCTPIINLFQTISEPITLTHTKSEYLLQAGLQHPPTTTQIHSIQKVSTRSKTGQEVKFHPMYGIKYQTSEMSYHYYHILRKEISQSEVFLAFSTDSPHLFYEEEWVITADVLCTNRDLPAQLLYGRHSPHLQLVTKNNFQGISEIRLIIPFTQAQEISLTDENIIQILMRYLLICQSPPALINLKNIFALYAPENANQIQFSSAIISTTYSPGEIRLPLEQISSANIRGTDIKLQVDTEKVSESQLFFFGNALEKYFALQAEINAYTRLIMLDREGKEIHRWPVRCGSYYSVEEDSL